MKFLMGFMLNKCWQIILLASLHLVRLEAATTGLQPNGTQCACVGDMLTYSCNAVGGGTTIWSGTVFNCPADSSAITLRHSQFASNQAFGICNDGDIVGRGIAVVNNCYTSQLNVTVREEFNNRTVRCVLNSNQGTREVGRSLLSVVSATNLYPPPNNIYLADAQPGKLIFNWDSVISNCSTPEYDITSTSDCGACPAVSNTTTAACSDLQLTTDAVTCLFRVSSRVCNLVGNPSSPIAVILKVPSIPQVELVPSYSNDSQALEKLFIITTMNQTEDLFYISTDIPGFPLSYTAHVSNFINDTSFNSTVGLSSCEETSGCPIELPNSSDSCCSQSTIINVSISAVNKLGEGPRSNPFMIECTNNFVQVLYNETITDSTISCVFPNRFDTSEKSCCITYQLCDQKGPQNVQECTKNYPYNIQLEVSDDSSHKYCYTVTASNHTYTVNVKGTFSSGDNRGGNINTAAVAAGTIVAFIFIALLLTSIDILVWVIIIRTKRKPNKDSESDNVPLSDIHVPNLTHYLIPYYRPDTLKLHCIVGGCKLKKFITDGLNIEFKRGHTFYEFTSGEENILEGQEVLLQDIKRTEKWFRLAQPKSMAAGGLKLYGKGISRKNFGDQHRVFIQSFGSGAEHYPHGSSILYNHGDQLVHA